MNRIKIFIFLQIAFLLLVSCRYTQYWDVFQAEQPDKMQLRDFRGETKIEHVFPDFDLNLRFLSSFGHASFKGMGKNKFLCSIVIVHRTDSTQNPINTDRGYGYRSISLLDSLAIDEISLTYLPTYKTVVIPLDEDDMERYYGAYRYGKSLGFGRIKVPKKTDSILVSFEARMYSLEGLNTQIANVEQMIYRYDTTMEGHYKFLNPPWD